jgi:ParB-like nuclease domain
MLQQIKTTISYTENLNQFKPSIFQRPISEAHVNHLIDSIQRENRLHLHPVIITSQGFIEDGQHRIEACKRLRLGMYYVINTKATDEAMIDDQIQKKWVMKDYFNYYVKKEIPEYIKLQYLLAEYELEFQQIYTIFATSRWNSSQKFRDGDFKISINDENFLKKLAKTQKEIGKSKRTKQMFCRRDFVRALYIFSKKYIAERFNRLLEKIGEHVGDLPEKASEKTYLNKFITIYNIHKGPSGGIKEEF